MRGFRAVCKRELRTYFTTPAAYVFLVVFGFFTGYLTFRDGFFANRQADMRLFFDNVQLLLIFLAPCAAMRLWSEERRSGSIEFLLTLPITVAQAVLGKFAAAWFFLAIALLLTAPMPMTVEQLGDPDWGPIACGYLGAFLMAGAFLGIGCVFSAMSKNQVISFILSVVACAVLVYAGHPSTLRFLSDVLPGGLVGTVERMSMATHFDSIRRGVLELRDLSYFALLICGGLYACTLVLAERRAA